MPHTEVTVDRTGIDAYGAGDVCGASVEPFYYEGIVSKLSKMIVDPEKKKSRENRRELELQHAA